jgi:hypothetical protein
MNKGKLYNWNKGLWLLMQSLLLPMSAIYLARESLFFFPNDLLKLLFALAGSLLLILWLIAQALLVMHHFPLRLAPALRLTAGYLFSFLIIWALEGTSLFAAYVAFYTTLLAMTACGAGLFFQAFRISKLPVKQLLQALPVFVVILIVTAWFFMPLLHGMDNLLSTSSLTTFIVLGINTLATTRALWGKTIFSAATNNLEDQYTLEWERWAGPTIITLILSATAALIIFSILTAG